MAINPINSSALLSLFGSSGSASSPDLLTTALSGATGGTAQAPTQKYAPTAPWSVILSDGETKAKASEAVRRALAGRSLVDENAAKLDLPGASSDYRKLFALYQGLQTLMDLAEYSKGKGLTSVERTRVSNAFEKGLAEVSAYIDASRLESSRLTQGEAAASVKTKLTTPKAATEYVTQPLTSSTSEPVPAFDGAVSFTISVKKVNNLHDVQIDLAEMGSAPRTIGNVINFINGKLEAEGLETRILTQRIPGQPRQVTVNGKTVTLPASSDQWALKVKAGTSESVAFTPTATAPAVYLTQEVGNPDPDGKATTKDGVVQRQFLKFQTDDSAVAAPVQGEGETQWVEGRVFAETLPPEIRAVRAQQVGPDGSVYMLADVGSAADGQAVKGDQDVALLKYDSAGKLLYTRTLGASSTATGLALAVSADGKVAVAGAVSGGLSGATEGALNSGETGAYAGKSDSFVTLYDEEGQELWTQRRGARQEDEASQVAFGADGTVYVTGRSKSVMQGGSAIGDYDGYLQAFRADATGKVQTLFTESFGSVGADRPRGLVVDGSSVVVASVEQGHAVLRRFDVGGAQPTLTASRDLGDLQGGEIAGLALDGGQVVVVGSTQNGFLSAGQVTRSHAGGTDVFAARLSANLSAGAGDRLAYYGGSGDDRAASMAVSGGKVWIGGSAGADLPDQDPKGKKDGFLTSLDVATGAVAWSRRFTGKDGYATPTSIAVAPTGASVLDRLGLPSGPLDLTDSERITAHSSLRAGDQFSIQVGQGRSATVTIEEKDTLDTLAQKIRRASGFQAKVTIATADGERSLRIEPMNPRTVIEVAPGSAGKDALAMLGIAESIIRAVQTKDGKSTPADGKAQIYGLGLERDLNLSSADQISHALAEVAAAMGVVRSVYKDMRDAATPKSLQDKLAEAGKGGKVPVYLTNQIANYQAALDRLTGGG
ncbi:hypothetical protein [Phenylobacterium sp.]|uniref:hypothetical protein n=1 Tax=Phenylobacterium sp. TaxID=1871053 RepID=UPI0035B05585